MNLVNTWLEIHKLPLNITKNDTDASMCHFASLSVIDAVL